VTPLHRREIKQTLKERTFVFGGGDIGLHGFDCVHPIRRQRVLESNSNFHTVRWLLARKQRFMRDYGLPAGDAQMFADDVSLGAYFEKAAVGAQSSKAVANWIINNLKAKLTEAGFELAAVKIPPGAIQELVRLVEGGQINIKIAQETVFPEMFATGASPAQIVAAKGLAQVSDSGAIERFCDDAITANPASAADFRAGKAAALNGWNGILRRGRQRGFSN